jgi:hypothetical protein
MPEFRNVWVGIIMATSATVFATVGCSSDEEPQATATKPPPSCPAAFESINGAPCSDEALLCAFPIPCSPASQQVLCTCSSGTFKCSDRTGPIARGAGAQCADTKNEQDKTCPADRAEAEDKACNNAGLQCFYKGVVCPESVDKQPNLDVCFCNGGADGGLAFHCESRACSATLPARDGG